MRLTFPRYLRYLVACAITASAVSGLHAQRPAVCDTTVLVSDTVAHIFDVRAAFADWILPNTDLRPLRDQPALRNIDQAIRRLVRSYPPHLRDAGLGGEALFAAYVDSSGAIAKYRLIRPSPYPELDKVAASVIGMIAFAPGRLEAGCSVPMIMHLPISLGSK